MTHVSQFNGATALEMISTMRKYVKIGTRLFGLHVRLGGCLVAMRYVLRLVLAGCLYLFDALFVYSWDVSTKTPRSFFIGILL